MTLYKKTILLALLMLAIGSQLVLGQQCTLNVTLTSTNNAVICSGNSVILTATATSGAAPYNYSWSTGETSTSISVNKGGTYTVTVSDQNIVNCPPVVKSITVTESTSPDAPTALGTKVCENTSATLTATAPGGVYMWYDAPSGGTLMFTGQVFTTPAITVPTMYYVDATLNGCTSPRTAVKVDLNTNPAGVGDHVCAGNPATLTASGGDTFQWYDQPGGTLVGTGATFITPPLITTTTYYVVAIVNGCGSSATPVTAIVTPYPQAPSASDATICTGTTANLHAAAGGIIDWFDVPTGGNSLISSPDFTTPILNAKATYYVQSTLNGCVSLRQQVNVFVNPIPEAPTVQAAPVCSGSSGLLSGSSPSGNTFNWYANADGSTLLATGPTYQTPALSKPTTYFAQTVNGGCVSTLTPFTVSILPSPAAPTASTSPVCPGTAATLTATNPGGSYAWYSAATGGTLVGTGDTFTTPPLAANTTYYVQTTLNGCTSSRTAVTATLFPATPQPTASGTTICSGDAATLVASGSNNYQWYDSPTGGNLLAAGKVFVTQPLIATTTFYVETTVNGCTSARTAVKATVTAPPATPTANDVNICAGTATTLTASAPGGGTLTWYDDPTAGSVLATGTTFTTPVLYNPATYYIENAIGTCVSSRHAVTVNTNGVTYPQFQYPSGTYCNSGPNLVPQINDPTGGTFSATPVGLVFVNTQTGEINLGASLPGKYTIHFVGNEVPCHSFTDVGFAVVLTPDAQFSYGGPYCQYANTNPSPTFPPTGASAGYFTASPAGLVFFDATNGVIDLQKSSPGTYNVTNTIAANGACPASSSTSPVTIVPGVKVYAGPDQTIKAGATAQLAGTITGISAGKWTGGTGTFSDPTLPNAVYTPGASETTAKLTLTSNTPPGNCGAKSDVMVITIVPQPPAPTAADVTVCTGSSANLSATAPGGTYTWYDAATGGNLLATGANFTTPVLNSSAVYYVQTTISVNTSARTAVNVTVDAPPVAPTAAGPSNVCFNTPAKLTASGSTGSYQWYDAATGGNMLATGSTFTTPALTAKASYFVQAVNPGCAGPRTQIDIGVTHAPTITSVANGAACSGAASTYLITSDSPAATYTWSRAQVTGISNAAVANQTGATITETLLNTTTSPVNVTYNITATDNTCSTAFQYVLTVKPTPVATSANKVIACSDSPVNYLITFNDPSTTFTWSRAAVPGVTNTSVTSQEATTIKEALHNPTSSPVDVVYTINYTNGVCASTFNFTATVNPVVTVTSIAEGKGCNGVPLNYHITSNIPSATFTWRREAEPGISNPAVHNQTSSTINETLVTTTTDPVVVVYDIIPNAFGCDGLTSVYVVTIYPIPPPATVALSNSPVCVGSTIQLQTPDVNGASYLWTGPNGFTSTDQNPVINNAPKAAEGTYNVSIVFNTCPSLPKSVDVKVNIPAKAVAGPDQTICITTTSVNLNGHVTGGTTTGQWSSSGTGTFSPASNVLNATYNPSSQDQLNGSVVLTLKSTSPDDCTPSESSLKIRFAPTPAVDAGPDQIVCDQVASVQLNGAMLKPGTATWATSGTGTFSPSTTQLNASYIPSADDIKNGSVMLFLNFNNKTRCDLAADTTVITLAPPPTVNAGSTQFVLPGHQVTLYPTVSDENVQYLWTPNVFINDNTIKNPVVTGDITRTYTLTVTDSKGCTSQSQVLVKVAPEINVNNTFTPNGDGTNDYWTITGLIAYFNADVSVFNRYGEKIYYSKGYPKAWDGTYNGRPLPAGTYYYVIRLNLGDQVLAGYVAIIR